LKQLLKANLRRARQICGERSKRFAPNKLFHPKYHSGSPAVRSAWAHSLPVAKQVAAQVTADRVCGLEPQQLLHRFARFFDLAR